MQALIAEGVVSRGDLFAKILKDSDIPPSGEASKKTDASAALRDAVDAAYEQHDADLLENRYRQSDLVITALNAMVQVHAQFRTTGTAQTAVVEALSTQLAADATPANEAPAPAAVASKGGGGATPAGKDKTN